MKETVSLIIIAYTIYPYTCYHSRVPNYRFADATLYIHARAMCIINRFAVLILSLIVIL